MLREENRLLRQREEEQNQDGDRDRDIDKDRDIDREIDKLVHAHNVSKNDKEKEKEEWLVKLGAGPKAGPQKKKNNKKTGSAEKRKGGVGVGVIGSGEDVRLLQQALHELELSKEREQTVLRKLKDSEAYARTLEHALSELQAI